MVPALQGWGILSEGTVSMESRGYGTVRPDGGTQLVRFILGDEGFHHAAHLFSVDCLDILIKQPFTD